MSTGRENLVSNGMENSDWMMVHQALLMLEHALRVELKVEKVSRVHRQPGAKECDVSL